MCLPLCYAAACVAIALVATLFTVRLSAVCVLSSSLTALFTAGAIHTVSSVLPSVFCLLSPRHNDCARSPPSGARPTGSSWSSE